MKTPLKTPLVTASALILTLGLFASSTAFSAENCTTDKAGLKKLLGGQDLFPNWIETTADDGKPLLVKMSEQGEKLYFVFDKTKEGVWAEGLISVCKEGDGLLVRISKQDIKVGPKAPKPVKWSMGSGAKFKLKLKDPEHLHVSTFGWSGDFIQQK